MKIRTRPIIIDNIILLCVLVALFTVSLVRYDNNIGSVLTSDPKGYYMYLPAVFIYGGIHHIPANESYVGLITNKSGETYPKFTCGTAYCYLPFFLIAHAYAKIFHLNASGFSPPYCYAIVAAGVCWAVFGLFLLKTLLLRYFSRRTTWLTILCITLGTNFYCYATLFVGMSHIYSFALFAAALLLTDSYYKFPSTGKAILLSLLLGWIILIRPTSTAIIIFLFLYRVVSFTDLKDRLKFFREQLSHLLIGVPFFIGIMFPQLVYWKEMSGQWIKYSYQNERFIYWANPKIASVLFDAQNGWLLYSPVLLFLFWGLIMKRKDPRISSLGTAILLVVITYVFASWASWSFGGAFGHRCYIDYYAIFAFPLAITMENILNAKSYYLKIPLLLVIALFCYYSVGMATAYFTHGTWDGPGWRWNYGRWLEVIRNTF